MGQHAHMLGLGDFPHAVRGSQSLIANPSLIRDSNDLMFGISYAAQYKIRELDKELFISNLSLEKNSFGLLYQRQGDARFQRQKIGINWSRTIGKSIQMGVRFIGIHHGFGDRYRDMSRLFSELGIAYQLSEKSCLGMYISNPSRQHMKNLTNNPIPTFLILHVHHSLNSKVRLYAGLKKSVMQPDMFGLGLSYHLAQNFELTMGYRSAADRIGFGYGFYYQNWRANLAFGFNQTFGWSSGFDIQVIIP
jgi:hypothetical protein